MIPDHQTLMRPVLACAAAGETRIGHAVEQIADKLGLTSDERAQLLRSGKQTMFANRVHWAKTYLVKAGLAERKKSSVGAFIRPFPAPGTCAVGRRACHWPERRRPWRQWPSCHRRCQFATSTVWFPRRL